MKHLRLFEQIDEFDDEEEFDEDSIVDGPRMSMDDFLEIPVRCKVADIGDMHFILKHEDGSFSFYDTGNNVQEFFEDEDELKTQLAIDNLEDEFNMTEEQIGRDIMAAFGGDVIEIYNYSYYI